MPMMTWVDSAGNLILTLEATAPDFITLTADITLAETVNVGADHTISIDSGVTLTIGDSASDISTMTVPSGTKLTIVGDGTLKVNNDTAIIGVMVLGDMVVDGAKLTVANKRRLHSRHYGKWLSFYRKRQYPADTKQRQQYRNFGERQNTFSSYADTVGRNKRAVQE